MRKSFVLMVLALLAGGCTELGDETPFPHRDASRPAADAGAGEGDGPSGDGAAADAEEPDAE